jgi:peptidoglycan/LPS O-acetylase OafA/YrhL
MQHSPIGLLADLSDLQPIIAMMIPIVAIIMGIGMGAWTVYLNYRKRRDMFALYHQERMAAIDKGIDLPPLPDEFFQEDGRHPRSPHAKLLAGLILLFLGLTMLCAMYFTHQGADSLWSLLLVGLGLAFLIYYFAVDKNQADLIDSKRQAELLSRTTSPKP